MSWTLIVLVIAAGLLIIYLVYGVWLTRSAYEYDLRQRRQHDRCKGRQ